MTSHIDEQQRVSDKGKIEKLPIEEKTERGTINKLIIIEIAFVIIIISFFISKSTNTNIFAVMAFPVIICLIFFGSASRPVQQNAAHHIKENDEQSIEEVQTRNDLREDHSSLSQATFDDNNLTIVIDNGSLMTKAGFSGWKTPQCVFLTAVGRNRYYATQSPSDIFIGDVNLIFPNLSLKYPIKDGIIENWDDMKKIWNHTFFKELCVDPKEHPVLLADKPFNTINNREKMISTMFDTFGVPSCFVCDQSLLSLFSVSRTTGIVLDIGDSTTSIVPIIESNSISHAIAKLELGGCDLTRYMNQCLEDIGFLFKTPAEKDIVRDVKEKCCYVARDFDAEMENPINYTLPDGIIITLHNEHFRCPEILFKPKLAGKVYDGIDLEIYNSIMKCDKATHKDLFSNIVLSGGSSMFRGLPERLEKEITSCAPKSMNINIIAPEERKYAAWIGGSILASLPTFPNIAITKQEYDENGPSIIRQKSF